MLEKFKKQEIQKPQAIYGGNVIIEDNVLLKEDIVVDDLIDGI
jgi:hypothetical protein